MNKNKKVYITAVAVITSTLLTISSAFAVDYYPEGPRLNVAVDAVESGGWELCFSDDFGNITTPVQNMLNQCPSDYIMLAGKFSNQPDIAVLAAGERSAVFQVQTIFDQKTLNNGTYFYFYPDRSTSDPDTTGWSHSIGFSRSEMTDIRTCDYWDENPPPDPEHRLCRHIQRNQEQPVLHAGYRIGSSADIFENNRATFQVYQMNSIRSSNLTYGNPNSYADPTGELRSLINQIKGLSGNLIGWK